MQCGLIIVIIAYYDDDLFQSLYWWHVMMICFKWLYWLHLMVAFGAIVFMGCWSACIWIGAINSLRVMMIYLYLNFGSIACNDADLLAPGLVILIATYTIISFHLNRCHEKFHLLSWINACNDFIKIMHVTTTLGTVLKPMRAMITSMNYELSVLFYAQCWLHVSRLNCTIRILIWNWDASYFLANSFREKWYVG